MTDAEINRAVAEARGYTVYHYDKDYAESCYYMLVTWDSIEAGLERATEAEAWADVPDVVNQWGAFFEELTREALGPNVDGFYNGKDYEAMLTYRTDIFKALADSPGRALALVFLKAKGRSDAV